MNKKKFLKLLEEKLQILSVEERNDILNEYKDTIEEKVRHGSSEEEAVADFGSIEELSREILKAYKINPDYSKTKEESSKEKIQDIKNQSEDLIKKGAKKLSEWTQEVVEEFKNNDGEWTLDIIFEMIIKAILLLIGLAVLRIPFHMIAYLGVGIFDMAFPPIDTLLTIVFKFLIGIVYFITCIVIAMIVFKPYVQSKKESKKKTLKNEQTPLKTTKEKGNIVTEIVKAFLFLIFVFPLYFICFGCYIAVAVLIFLLTQGIPIVGPLLIIFSVSIFFTFLTKLCYQLLYDRKRISAYSLIISSILFASGCFFTLNTISSFEVYKGLPDHSFKTKQVVYKKTLTSTDFDIDYWDFEKQEDESLADNEIEITVTYYPDFITEIKENFTMKNETLILYLRQHHNEITSSVKKNILNLILEQLKQLHWYQYEQFTDLEIVVKANKNTIDKIK